MPCQAGEHDKVSGAGEAEARDGDAAAARARAVPTRPRRLDGQGTATKSILFDCGKSFDQTLLPPLRTAHVSVELPDRCLSVFELRLATQFLVQVSSLEQSVEQLRGELVSTREARDAAGRESDLREQQLGEQQVRPHENRSHQTTQTHISRISSGILRLAKCTYVVGG